MPRMSHTPGPWTAKGYPSVYYPDGVWYIEGPAEDAGADGFINAADARLIAAAPDLLAALQGVAGFAHAMAEHDRKYDTLGFMVNCPDKRCIAARAAIAKATEPIVAAV